MKRELLSQIFCNTKRNIMGNKGSSLTNKSDMVVRQNPSRRNSGLTLIEKRVAYKTDVEMIEKEAISKMQKHPKGLNEELIPGNVDMTPDGTHLNEDSKSFIRQALLKIGVFTDEMNKRNISVADVQNIINAFGTIDFEDGEFLYNRNDFPSDYLFIAKSGIFRGLVDGEYKSEMRPSDVIGDMEFFYQMPRTQSIEASRANGKNPSVYCLSKRDFKRIVEKGRDLGSMRMLQALSEAQKYLVKDKVTIINYYRGVVNNLYFITF
jgi:Cyclic nucleotide-binding domain